MAGLAAKWAEKVSRRLFIGGNWKCNGSVKTTESLIKDTVNKIEFDTSKLQVLVSPVYLHLPLAKKLLNPKVILSAQNVSQFKNGAYTGEISAQQLKDFGIDWTLIGHSERRTYFGETNDVVATKVKMALSQGLNIVFCIGEKLAEREAGRTLNICLAQVEAVNKTIQSTDWNKIVIAYEPVWAIGTGKEATPAQGQEVHEALRDWLKTKVSEEAAKKVRVIYGGSVSDKNAAGLIEQPDIDGFLVLFKET
eukprot:TRINITY_DN9501_c0_g2_i8.p1 TRINITY_DN9501_c0_g2~~TRINITY_DN9501_c0_g2_i8.p1  ORF type:complete len:251 (+),score=70.54 TRINITY_DN9501_c0_g2_i8:269-1021(+)